jgi:hypothetical protein
MTTAFIVKLDTDAGEDLDSIAQQIANMLDTKFVVVEVKSWHKPSNLTPPKPATPGSRQVLEAFAAARAQGL